jgi:hypothetical protein
MHRAINFYIGAFVITLAGAFAALFILRVANTTEFGYSDKDLSVLER